jgi:uncharacterized membrane protein YraQ (UPF0718 family)
MKVLYLFTGICLVFSLVADSSRTWKALKIAAKRFFKLLGEFTLLLILVSLALTMLPPRTIVSYLEGPGMIIGTLLASLVGSLTFIPGFISYPLAGILHSKGVPYTVLAAFVTTLMMVGVVTFPLEQKILGTKVAVVRNLLYFFLALVTSLAIGLIFGELL